MLVSELEQEEYNPFYQTYIDQIPAGGLLDGLNKGLRDIEAIGRTIPEEKVHFAYARDKWTLAEVLIHLADAERVFQYRALRFARNDNTPLEGFDENAFVAAANAGQRSLQDILDEFSSVRRASLALFSTFGEAQLKKRGVANGSPMSVRALGFVIIGHQRHHFNILNERYLR